MDFADFSGMQFEGDDLYKNALATALYRAGNFVEIETPEGANYTSSIAAGIYAHRLETFIPSLDAATLSNLHLATKRRYLVVFQTMAGRYFTFGYDAGAAVTYTNQTNEATGALMSIAASSIYPLFELSAAAINGPAYTAEFIPDFDTLTYCINA